MKQLTTQAARAARQGGRCAMVLMVMAVGCLQVGCGRRGGTVAKEPWPFQELELREARHDAFEGSSLEHDEYGPLYVANAPFVGTSDVERLECRDGHTWVHLSDRGATLLSDMTGRLVQKGQLAMYMDRKLIAAPLIMEQVRGGQFMLLTVPCKGP